MSGETEQNKTEEPTPYKLRRARQKGMVARGADLGFMSTIIGFSFFVLLFGAEAAEQLTDAMARLLSAAPFSEPDHVRALIVHAAQKPISIVLALSVTVVAVVVLVEAIQIRGIVFSGDPLKPDFNRLNPAKNLKRLFSTRMLIETLKSVAKLIAYATVLYLIIADLGVALVRAPADGASMADLWREGLVRLLLSFGILALLFAIIDQVLSRREFQKQMRMTRSELTREIKEREGEPRQKQKRKRMHAEFVKQTRALAHLHGADVLIVNPHHYAIGLRYDPANMRAPRVVAKGRNRFALILKKRAALWSILTISDPPLARALYRAADVGQEVDGAHYTAVANIYRRIPRFNVGSKLEHHHAAI